MSRTYRRKSERLEEYYKYEWEYHYGMWMQVRMNEEELEDALIRYHMDNPYAHGRMNWHVPAGYRRAIERRERVREKAESRRLMLTERWDEYTYERRYKDASYTYW